MIPNPQIVRHQVSIKIQHLETKMGKLRYAGKESSIVLLGLEDQLQLFRDILLLLETYDEQLELFRPMAEIVKRRQALFDEEDPERVRGELDGIAQESMAWTNQLALRRWRNVHTPNPS